MCPSVFLESSSAVIGMQQTCTYTLVYPVFNDIGRGCQVSLVNHTNKEGNEANKHIQLIARSPFMVIEYSFEKYSGMFQTRHISKQYFCRTVFASLMMSSLSCYNYYYFDVQ